METSRSVMADSITSCGSLAGVLSVEGRLRSVVGDGDGSELVALWIVSVHNTAFICLSSVEASFATSARSCATSTAMSSEGVYWLTRGSAELKRRTHALVLASIVLPSQTQASGLFRCIHASQGV